MSVRNSLTRSWQKYFIVVLYVFYVTFNLPVFALSMSSALSKECGIYEQSTDFSEKLIDAGRYQLAGDVLKLKKEIYSDPALFLNLIYCHYCCGEYKNAVDECDMWSKQSSGKAAKFDAFLLAFKGSCFIRLHDYQRAADAFKDSIRVAPSQSAEAGLLVAEILIDRSKPPSERKSLNSVISLRDLSKRTLDTLLQLHFAQGSVPSVETPRTEWRERSNDKVLAIVTTAEESERLGDFQKASQLYSKALELEGSNAALWNELALCEFTIYKDLKDKDLPTQSSALVVRKACQKATKLGGNDWRFWNNFGLCMEDVFPKDANAAFEKALQSPDLPPYRKGILERALRTLATMQSLQEGKSAP